MTRKVLERNARWSDKVDQYSKAIVAFLTPAVFLGVSLGATLPAEKAAPITAATAIATGFLTWLKGNTEILKGYANDAEEAIEDVIGRGI